MFAYLADDAEQPAMVKFEIDIVEDRTTVLRQHSNTSFL